MRIGKRGTSPTTTPSAHTGILTRTLLLLALAIGAATTGCANKQAQQPSALEIENQELRARLAQVDAALAEAEGRAGTLEGEVDRLEAERAALQQQLDSSSRPAVGRNTGFEGISDISVSSRPGELVVDIAADVLFASGSATLRNDAKQRLDQVAGVLNSRYASNQIRVAGHSDSDPIRKSSWKTNERLSAERALAVEEYLVSRGISQNRTHIAAYGPSNPKGTKAASRRVEIIILSGN
ncbi:MAG: OmpA family protein [Phycisphaerales bacterium]